MKKPLLGKVALIVLVSLSGWLVLASAQDDPNKKPPGDQAAKKAEGGLPNAYRFNATRPQLTYAADVRLPLANGHERVVYVVPQVKGSDLHVPGLFFYTPPFCLAEGDKSHDGFPKVVRYADRQDDGSTRLGFRAVLRSDVLQQHALAALRDQPKARALWAGADKLEEKALQAEHWPVIHAIIALVDVRRERDFLATTDAEVRGGSTVDFEFALTEPELAAVRRLAKEDRLGLVYSYSFIGKGQDYGVVDLQAVQNLKVHLGSKLTSEQLEGKAPIFQGQKDEAARYTALMVSKTGYGNNRDVLAMVNTPTLAQHLFAPGTTLTLDQLKQDSEAAKQVLAYLTPQIEKVQTAHRNQQADREVKEKTDFDVTTSGVTTQSGIGVIIKGIGLNFGLGTSSEHKKGSEVKSLVETATGSEWVVGKEQTTLIPHKIKVWKFVQGSDQTVLSDRSAAYIAVDKENYYYQDKVVPLSFTEAALGRVKPTSDGPQSVYAGVPLGGVIPFFGKEPPRGYRWCNGNDPKDHPKGDNIFPKAAWVPDHLAGLPLPDMREQLIGGAKDEKAVGLVYDKGQLVVKGQEIPGKSFLLPKPEPKAVFADGANGAVGVVSTVEGKLGFWTNSAGGKHDWYGGKYKSFDGKEKLDGTYTTVDRTLLLDTPASNPRHMMTRFVIRVE